ncbi:MAG: helix-turn-helix domain-containing protein [Desulfosudaceae bacterium]
MRLLDDLSYYEILEVSPEASASEIRQARQKFLMLYRDDPIVADSFFTEKEKQQIIDRIETAFAVLSDPAKRQAYDRELRPAGESSGRKEDSAPGDRPRSGVVSPLIPGKPSWDSALVARKMEDQGLPDKARRLIDEIRGRETVSGADIRALRRALQITVTQVFEITRIREALVRAIENDRFDELPPPVYLRGFLESYADLLHLPPEVLRRGYFRHMTVS